MAKLPSFQFYPGDWQKDPNLKRATHEEKGVWIDMLCLMWECEERGILATAGISWTDDEIASAVGGDFTRTLSCVKELVRKGIARRNTSGAIYSARMVRDEQIREIRKKSGSMGGNPNLLNQKDVCLTKNKPNVNQSSNQNPTPSVSVSSSVSYTQHNTAPPETTGDEHKQEKSNKKPSKALPGYQDVISHIMTTYKAKKGVGYPMNSTHGNVIKSLVRLYSVAQLKALWDLFLSKSQNWIDKNGNVVIVPQDIMKFSGKLTILLEDGSWKIIAEKYEQENAGKIIDLPQVCHTMPKAQTVNQKQDAKLRLNEWSQNN